MKITLVLIASSLAALSLAQDRPVAEKSAQTADLVTAPALSRKDAVNTGTSEVFQNLVIAAGKSMALDSSLDYSSAATVAISVLCIICTSGATSLGNSGLVLQAAWTVPDAGSYVTTENKTATAFPYTDAGGAVFNIYGPQFRLVLQNKGAQTIALQQVTIFRRSQ
jgi:hypothetical protein